MYKNGGEVILPKGKEMLKAKMKLRKLKKKGASDKNAGETVAKDYLYPNKKKGIVK